MIGCDIIEISRIEQSMSRQSFVRGVFTAAEISHYKDKGEKPQTLAGIFCAKEAVAKALGCGFNGFRPTDIEVCYSPSGAPSAVLFGGAEQLLNGRKIEISISHCDGYAMAVAVINEK